MIASAAFVLLQIGVQLVLAAGFSACLWWGLKRPSLAGQFSWLWLGLAGVAVPYFLLQLLVYAGLPLRLTAAPVFAVALVAALACTPAVWRSLRADRTLRSDAWLGVALFTVTLAVQATGLIAVGPTRYQGAGHYDQATYVVTAEFLVSEPFATKREEVGYRPWMLRALEMKPGRITGMVALGATAVVSRADCQQAYGAVNVFFVTLLTLAVAGLALTSGLPRWAVVGAALLAGLSPAVTRVHLEGFFSQATSLFVFPALAGVLGGTGGPRRLKIACAGVLLAFLIGTYSELTPFGILFVGGLQAAAPGPWGQRARDLMLVLAVGLLVNAGYSIRLADYLFSQVSPAQNPSNLAAIFPDSGTWAGWGRFFCEAGPAWATGILGVGSAILGLVGCIRLAGRRQFALPVAALTGGVILAYLRFRGEFHPYVFAKLGIEFIGVWSAGAFAGLGLWPRAGRWGLAVGGSLGALLVLGAVVTTCRRHEEIRLPVGRLALLSSEYLAGVRREVGRHPERTYLVACNDPLVAEWLAYFGRRSPVVLDRRTFGDRIVTTEENACRRWPADRKEIWWLDPARTGPVPAYEPAPALAIEGALETGQGPAGRHYVIGGRADFTLTAGVADRRRELWLDFVAVPLAAGRTLQLQLDDGAGQVVSRRMDRAGWVRWPLAIGAGRNRFRFSVSYEDGAAAPGDGSLLVKLPSVEVSGELPVVDGDVGRFL